MAGGDADAPPPSLRPDAVDQALRAFSDPSPRDTIVDSPSKWRRLLDWFGSVRKRAKRAETRAPLSSRLPPVPPRRPAGEKTWISGPDQSRNERGEYLFIELLRMPREYQEAVIEVAQFALDRREDGPNAYTEAVVHFALSRCRADAAGGVPLERVCDILCDLSFAKTIEPALVRLSCRGVIELLPAVDTGNGKKLPRARVLVMP